MNWFLKSQLQMKNNIFSSARSIWLLFLSTEKLFEIPEKALESILVVSLSTPEITKSGKVRKTALISIEAHIFVTLLLIRRHSILIVNLSLLFITQGLVSLSYLREFFLRFRIGILIRMQLLSFLCKGLFDLGLGAAFGQSQSLIIIELFLCKLKSVHFKHTLDKGINFHEL